MTTNAPTYPTQNQNATGAYGNEVSRPRGRKSTETKASFKTTELIAYVVAVVGILVASAMADGASDKAQDLRGYAVLSCP